MGTPDILILKGDETNIIEQDGYNVKVPLFSHYIYRALLNQTGTSDPVATILEDTFPEPVIWERGDSKTYRVIITGFFTEDLTYPENCERVDDNTIHFTALGDDMTINAPVCIRVYVINLTDVVTGIITDPGEDNIEIEWDNNADEYQIKRRSYDGADWMLIYSGSSAAYTDFDLLPDTLYEYGIRQKENGKGWSKWRMFTETTISV